MRDCVVTCSNNLQNAVAHPKGKTHYEHHVVCSNSSVVFLTQITLKLRIDVEGVNCEPVTLKLMLTTIRYTFGSIQI